MINLSTQSESHLFRIFTGSCTTRTHEDTRVHKAWARFIFSSNSKRKETLHGETLSPTECHNLKPVETA